MDTNLVLKHAQLEATRAMLWSLALKEEAEDNYKERDTLSDVLDLIVKELIKIELSTEWEEYVNGTSQVK